MAITIQSVDYQLQIARQYGAPLDKYTLFDTLQEAKNYAKTPRAYIGQILSVIEGGTVHVYFINYAMELEEVGGVVAWDEITGKPDVVTTNTVQTITAKKTFTSGIEVNGVNEGTGILISTDKDAPNTRIISTGLIRTWDENSVEIDFPFKDGTVALTSDIIHYMGATTGRGSVVVGIQVIGDKITAVLGDLAWEKVTGKPSWIGSSKPSYSWDEITGKPDVVTTNTVQTITAEKQFDNEVTFAGDVNFSNRTILVNSDETLSQESIMFPARSGTLALTSDIIHYTGATTGRGSVVVGIQVIGDKITAVLGDLAWEKVTGKPSWIGSSKPSYSWDEITGKPDVAIKSDLNSYVTLDTKQTIVASKQFDDAVMFTNPRVYGEPYIIIQGDKISYSTTGDSTDEHDIKLDEIVTTNTPQSISGQKKFLDEVIFEKNTEFRGTRATVKIVDSWFPGVSVYSRDAGVYDGAAYLYNGITYEYDEDKYAELLFPKKSGTIALTNDFENLVTTNTVQTIGAEKTFRHPITVAQDYAATSYRTYLSGNIIAVSLTDSSGTRTIQYGPTMISKVTSRGLVYNLHLPDRSGTVATLDDIDEKINEAIITALNTPV